MEALDILETCLYVDDLEAAEQFYSEVLTLSLVSKAEERHLFFKLGDGMLLLFKPEASLASGDLPPHGSTGAGHCCFKIDERDYEAWLQHLETNGVDITAIQTWPGGAKSFYFNDPAGNVLELAPARIWA